MEFEHVRILNFEGAFRGMRNPLNSWAKSDSFFGYAPIINGSVREDLLKQVVESWAEKEKDIPKDDKRRIMKREDYQSFLKENGLFNYSRDNHIYEYAYIGPNDMGLAKKLKNAGSEHRKFLRQIIVSVDITAPLYWWKEFDTYKVGTVSNSTSTMHTLATTPITLDCFEIDDYSNGYNNEYGIINFKEENEIEYIIQYLEKLRIKYNETKDKKYWKELIRWLPESWLQKRTITFNYENLLSMGLQRDNHKLTEWHSFIEWESYLPYADQLLFFDF